MSPLVLLFTLLLLNWILKKTGIAKIFCDCYVKGYYKKNGTYVQRYRRQKVK